MQTEGSYLRRAFLSLEAFGVSSRLYWTNFEDIVEVTDESFFLPFHVYHRNVLIQDTSKALRQGTE